MTEQEMDMLAAECGTVINVPDEQAERLTEQDVIRILRSANK